MAWREVAGNWLWIPPQPTAIIHFLGGAFVATAPYITYKLLLEAIGQQGYLIVATPFINTFDHEAIAKEVLVTFEQALYYLENRVTLERLPVYGLGHSMGCKIHLLLNSLYGVERAGNVLMAFNNYSARRSIPFLDQVLNFSPDLTVEFTPSPEETLRLVDRYYEVERNLLIKFQRDDIDQTRPLYNVLSHHFPSLTSVEILPGTHTTPLAQDIPWQPGRNFSALDAIGQFVKQEFTRDLKRLQDIILLWLNPLSTARSLRR
ncbi:MAG: DUF1350 family protein [Leptolyngbya sp. SIO1E4]|nr:DUF1350 family protein [Leptolyngbya sp. SIO1E4]